MNKSDDCLFCKIITRQIPSNKVCEGETTYAFSDINPEAKAHVLVVSKKHYANVAELAAGDPTEPAHIVSIARNIADKESHGAYRLVFNTGLDAGQAVFHVHTHVMTGEKLDEQQGNTHFMATTTRTTTIPPQLDPVTVLGPVDEVIREVERTFPDLTIIARGNRMAIVSRPKQTGAQAAQAEDLANTIIQAAYTASMGADTVRRILDQDVLKDRMRLEHPGRGPVRDKLAQSASNEHTHTRSAGSHDPTYHKPTVPGVITFATGMPVRAKTAGQVAYMNVIESHTITFGIGSAGTGKTYLAVTKAVRAFQNKQIRRVILAHPAVEAGESLGFLPDTLNDKVDPYLHPLYDALGDMLGADQLEQYMDDGSTEVAPPAYIHGRTLNNAFVILNETRNTTEQQMEMSLTRLGFSTTMIIIGGISQVDLTVSHPGLAIIKHILGGINNITFVHLRTKNVVRHQLAGQIVATYDRHSVIAGDHRDIGRRGRRNHTGFDARQQADSTNQSETDNER